MLRAVSTLDRVRLQLDRVRAALGEIDPVFLDTPGVEASLRVAREALLDLRCGPP